MACMEVGRSRTAGLRRPIRQITDVVCMKSRVTFEEPAKHTQFPFLPRLPNLCFAAAVFPLANLENRMKERVVLVVDDEEGIRTLAAIALQRAGFRVLATGDADEALQLSRTTESIDILLTDVQMGVGRMDGFEMAALIANERPRIPAIVSPVSRMAGGGRQRRGSGFWTSP